MALLQEIRIPLLSVNDTSLTIVEIAFPNGHLVKKGDTVMVFETSKTTYDAEAEVGGFIQYLCEPGNDYEVNHVVARIFGEAAEIQMNAPIGSDPESGNSGISDRSVAATGKRVITEKISSREAMNGVDPGKFLPESREEWQGETIFSNEALLLMEASGIAKDIFKARDFVTVKDVEMAAGKTVSAGNMASSGNGRSAAAASPVRKIPPPPDPSKTIVERLSSNKRREIEYLGEVQSAGLTSTINVTVETENIFGHLNRSLKYLRNSLLPVILYETGRLLVKYPVLNAFFTGDGIAQYKEVNIGFAIDLDKGLKVLKIAGTDKKTIGTIEEEILSLSNRYLDDALKIDDLTDITFTVTDLSSESVAFFRPLINMMNSSILGVSAIDEKLQRCILSMTFDHRVTEGKLVATFLRELKDRLESYRSDALPGKDIACFKCLKSLQEDLADTGFVKCVTPQGKEGYICQACLKGF